MGAVQQWTQHPFGVGRPERADVGIEQADHFRVLASHAQSLPDGPALARRARDVKTEIDHRLQQVANGRAIGPVHLHRERHSCKEGLGRNNVLSAVGGEGDHEPIQAGQRCEGVADQPQGRTAEFLHQARNQQCCGTLTQLLVEGEGIEITEAVVMNRGDQALLKIHAVFDATTVAEVMTHT